MMGDMIDKQAVIDVIDNMPTFRDNDNQKFIHKTATKIKIELLQSVQPKWYRLLASEYLSKCECCDECFAEFYCIENQLRASRVPQDYCVKNIYTYLKNRQEDY